MCVIHQHHSGQPLKTLLPHLAFFTSSCQLRRESTDPICQPNHYPSQVHSGSVCSPIYQHSLATHERAHPRTQIYNAISNFLRLSKSFHSCSMHSLVKNVLHFWYNGGSHDGCHSVAWANSIDPYVVRGILIRILLYYISNGPYISITHF